MHLIQCCTLKSSQILHATGYPSAAPLQSSCLVTDMSPKLTHRQSGAGAMSSTGLDAPIMADSEHTPRPAVLSVCSWIRMTATPVEALLTNLRAARSDLLRAACDGQDDADAVAAYFALPERADYFQLGRTDDGAVSACVPQMPAEHCRGAVRAAAIASS